MPQHTRIPPEFARGPMLPGTHECLTMQVNATVYPKAGTIRSVCIVRDPITGVELGRTVLGTTPVHGGARDFRADFATALNHLLYLCGLNDEGRRIEPPQG